MNNRDERQPRTTASKKEAESQVVTAPSISLPKGGGAIRGIGEKFAANPVTGTGSMNLPIACSPGRSGFGPSLSLSYDSGSGNGPFGFGWQLSIPLITRRTDRGLPKYDDGTESDVFLLSGSDDLVPILEETPTGWKHPDPVHRILHGTEYIVRRYRPRIEGSFARIERWTQLANAAHTFWRSISRDNITTWYGKTEESRVADPNDAARTFQWLSCETYDDKGNVIAYGYKKENSDGVDITRAHERNRSDKTRSANRYLKRVRYGNRAPYVPNPGGAAPTPLPSDWCFELVFDYGDHDMAVPLPEEPARTWVCRSDPFSSLRAGFDVRTYRLCRRVLMFHHFIGQPAIGRNCLVRSTDLTFTPDVRPVDPQNRIYAFLATVTQTGYTRQAGGYLSKSLPPLEFEYTEPLIDPTLRDVDDAVSLENLPNGLDGARYQFVDLDGDGVSGILTEQAGSWLFKPNLSPSTITNDAAKPRPIARFGPTEIVARIPSLAALNSGRQQLLDLAGNGKLDLVEFRLPVSGFFERTANKDWEPFQPFEALPALDWSDPRIRFIDLTGDGHADILITEDQVLCWYASLGEAGFGPAERVLQAFDEETGPRLAFADGSESIFLADLSGDGLTDLVRIRNGEVCYWPNLGYGRFGAKVSMDDAPWFEDPDLFNGNRVRLADIDGSGTTDLIYLGTDGVQIYFNQSGNGWSSRHLLNPFPPVDHSTNIEVLDLLGNGTACLVWSSPLPGGTLRPMRYVDLMGGIKPHLLIRVSNNLGAETRVHYAPSTKFSVADSLAGRRWITKVPFPVHVVERVETFDYVGRNHFLTHYAYHHGFYDGVEREFRGFALVEQWDTELFATFGTASDFPVAANIDLDSHIPPVHTKSWFHTGMYLGRNRVSRSLAGEYYREPALSDEQAAQRLLDDTVLDGGWTVEEEREACRALKGSMLRQEVYALDGSAKQAHPYTVTEQNFNVRRLQAIGGNCHGVFFATSREALTYTYERNPVDPRVSHALTIEVDAFGINRRSLAVAYGRRAGNSPLAGADLAKQTTPLITYAENDVTNAIDDPDAYRTPLVSAARTYELTGFPISEDTSRLGFDTWTSGNFALLKSAAEISYEEAANPIQKQRRLIRNVRTLFRRDDMRGLLAANVLQPLALPGEGYKLAFTPGLITEVYQRPVDGKPPENLLPDRATALFSVGEDRGSYVDLEGDGSAWLPSGKVFFWTGANALNPAATASQELIEASTHFYQAQKWADPFGQSTTAAYDVDQILVIRTADATGNAVSSQHDYRVLQPSRVTDPNGNSAEAIFDALGMLVATAVRGKAGQDPGDTLVGVPADLTTSQSSAFFDALDPRTSAPTLLKTATTRIIYDIERFRRTRTAHPSDQSKWEPVGVASLARETHVDDTPTAGGLKIQISLSYSDGFGREIQKKIQAEPGLAPQRDGSGRIIVDSDGQPIAAPTPVSPRWVGGGWTVFNNKGKPVRQFEPFFSDTHRFDFDVRIGVSPVLFYDPMGRVAATLHPNRTWGKVVLSPWRKETWDANDVVLISNPKSDLDAGDFFARLPSSAYFPTWYTQRQGGALGSDEQQAARKTAAHAATPTIAHADSLGRDFLTVSHNKSKYSDTPSASPPVEELLISRVILDIDGNPSAIIDAKDRVVMRYGYDMLGNRIHQASMEAGARWILNDVAGKPIYAWDSRAHRFRSSYDALRRPTTVHLKEGAGTELLVGRTVYGETRANAATNNLCGKVVELFDQAGVVTSDEYDFKDNLLSSRRQLARDYSATLDWSAAVPLAPPLYTNRTRYDALNRPIQLIAPHSNLPGATINIIQPSFNEANLPVQVDVWLGKTAVPTGMQPAGTADLHAVTNIEYDAKGQRTAITYGNGVRTTYAYEPITLRLTNVVTRRAGLVLQNLSYTYDPAGNITHIRDTSQQTHFFQNKLVEPSVDYTYDALYRLIEATGREHLGQVGADPSPSSYNDNPRVGIPLATSDGNAMGRYVERYLYDAAGNFERMKHIGSDPANPGWQRRYTYGESSQVEVGKQGNRLTSTATDPSKPEIYSTGGNGYDVHGNMLRMPHLQEMRWDFKDQLRMTQRQKVNASDEDGAHHQGERTWYVYDASGQRIRKVTESSTGVIRQERVYFDGFEIFRKNGGTPVVRESLHIMDDKQRIALVETRTQGNDGSPRQLIRYQHTNHLGSASLELDDEANIISYEEYSPYGSTSYQAVRSQTETPKRYRYIGKERDEETGFAYHGARYFASWLGRWTSCDPIGIDDGLDAYVYSKNNPIMLSDPQGTECGTTDPNAEWAANALNPGSCTSEPRTVDLTTKTPAGRELDRRAKDPGDTLPGPKAALSPKQAPSQTSQPSASWLHSQTIGVGFYRKPTPGDIITPVASSDTGSTALNIPVNTYLTLSNLVAAGINTVGNLTYLGEKGAKAVGFSETDIQAFKDLTASGELTTALATAQEASAFKAAAATAKSELISSEATAVLSETSAAVDATGELNLATNLRTPLQFGHNAAGGTISGVSQGFHQAGDVALSSNPLLRQLQIAKGGFPTVVESFTFERAAAGGQYNLLRLDTTAENAARAIGWGRLLERNPQLLGSYSIFSNSCTTVSLEILQAGRISPAIWARSPATLQLWFRLQGGR